MENDPGENHAGHKTSPLVSLYPWLWYAQSAPPPLAGCHQIILGHTVTLATCLQRSMAISKGERSMIDSTVQRLLEQVIDSPVKLQLLLTYYENPRMEGTAFQIAERIYRDIWSAREALRELAEDGILTTVGVGPEPVYRYRPRPEYTEPIFRLVQS